MEPVDRTDAEIVVATLRHVASWLDSSDRSMLLEAADQTILDEAAGWGDCYCCPICQEVVCDKHCPLYPVRAASSVWAISSEQSPTE